MLWSNKHIYVTLYDIVSNCVNYSRGYLTVDLLKDNKSSDFHFSINESPSINIFFSIFFFFVIRIKM
jgi:hypothetical protein